MPHGVLFRGGPEKEIRKCLVEGDQLEAVIGLPPNLFYSTPIPACVLILRSRKREQLRGAVLFVDASSRFEKARNQNRLRNQDVDAIVTAYRQTTSSDSKVMPKRIVGYEEMRGNNWDLNISRYLKSDIEDSISVKDALDQFVSAQLELGRCETQLLQRLKAAGYE
jgi:type I restriction enzyme M protein